jgi:hypothetical protein
MTKIPQEFHMKALKMRRWSALMPILLVIGCGGKDTASTAGTGQTSPNDAGKKYVLTTEPAGAKMVKEVRKEAKDGDEVVIVGHIGGEKKPWVEGRATFWIVDPSIKPCPSDEGCPTPWDCCCEPKAELVKAMATIKVVDEQGQTVPVDARQLLGVKESQTIVVHGRAKRDDQGNLVVLADGVFVRH